MARKFNGDILVKNNATVEAELVLSSKTASRALIIDGSNQISDSVVTSTELGHLSGVTSGIQTQLDAKLDDFTSTTDNALLRTDGTAGEAVQDSGIIIDDSDNMSGVNDLTIDGNLTVNGTTTTVNTSTLEVTDANIVVNDGGNQASADTQDAGITVEMSDATDAAIGYDSTATSRFKIGEIGSLVEIADISSAQTFTNKTMDFSSGGTNSITADSSDILYDNSTSGLTATDVKAALDELKSEIDSASDELVKISANDTTAGYLEDKIVAGSTKLSVTTLNDGADEDLELDVVESNINHDNLSGFVANEHIDHSTVQVATAADSGLSGGGDITATRNLSVDISGTTAESTADDADSILIYDDSAAALRSQTRSDFQSGLAKASDGDLAEDSFSGTQSASSANVTGFAFSNAVVRSFNAHVSVLVDADSDLYEEFDLQGIQKGASWEIASQSLGDDSEVSFGINSSGQITYSSGSYTGFVSLTIKFRAITTSV